MPKDRLPGVTDLENLEYLSHFGLDMARLQDCGALIAQLEARIVLPNSGSAKGRILGSFIRFTIAKYVCKTVVKRAAGYLGILVAGKLLNDPIYQRSGPLDRRLLAGGAWEAPPINTPRNARPKRRPSFEDFMNVYHSLLEDDLLTREFAATHNIPVRAADDSYIPRQVLQDEFNRAVAQGAQIVCLTGDRGFGKSTLARAFTRRFEAEGRDVLWLDASDKAKLYRGIAERLGERHVKVTGITPPELQRGLAAYLGSKADDRPVVVLDNAPSWKVAEDVIGKVSSAFYLLTSNNGAILPTGAGISIDVGSMTALEAGQMVQRLLGDQITEEDRRRLIARLNCRPIAIEHTCSHLRRTQRTVEGLFKQLDVNAARFFGRPSEGINDDQLLTLIYQGILADLNGRDPEAAMLLKIVACVAPDRIPLPLLAGAYTRLGAGGGADPDQDHDGGFFLALDELMRLRIVKAENQFLNIHSLTQEILRDIVDAEADGIAVAVQQTFLTTAADIAPFGLLPTHLLDQAVHVANALTCLTPDIVERRHPLRLGYSVAVACRALEHVGALHARAHVLTHVHNKILSLDDFDRWSGSLDDLELFATAARAQYRDRVWEHTSGSMIESSFMHGQLLNEIARAADHPSADTRPYRYPWWHLLRLEGALRAYQHYAVLERLQLVEAELVAEHEHDTAWRAEALLHLGRIRTNLAMWKEAERTLDRARQLFVADDTHAVYGQISVLIELTWCRLLESGDADTPAAQLYELYKLHGHRLSYELAARIAHVVGVSYTNGFIRRAALGMEVNDRVRANGVQALHDALDWYGNARQRHDMLRVRYDLLCVKAAVLRSDSGMQTVVSEVRPLVDEVRLLGDPELTVRFELLAAKLRYLQDGTHPVSLVPTLERIAFRAAFDVESPYWYSEALLTAGLVALPTGGTNTSMPQRLCAVTEQAMSAYRPNPHGLQALIYQGRADRFGILSY